MRVLRNESQIRDAYLRSQELGLFPHPDYRKSWDNVLAVEFIKEHGDPRRSVVVDLGCRSGVTLVWLAQLGFMHLYGCDARYPWPPLRKWLAARRVRAASYAMAMILAQRIRLRRQNVEQLDYPASAFDFATCMSVIEHGVNLERFFAGVSRLLKPGGYLVMSTDYWPEGQEQRAVAGYGKAWGTTEVMSRSSIMRAIDIAAKHGLEVTALDHDALQPRVPVIEWEGLRFTFLWLAFRRISGSAQAAVSNPLAS